MRSSQKEGGEPGKGARSEVKYDQDTITYVRKCNNETFILYANWNILKEGFM